MTNRQLLRLLKKIGACKMAVNWVKDTGYSLQEAWDNCPHYDWMQWLIWACAGKADENNPFPGWPSYEEWKKAIIKAQGHVQIFRKAIPIPYRRPSVKA